MGVIDPTKGYRAVEARLARVTDPRRRTLLECLRDHLLAEAEGDFELLLSTLAPNPQYHFWVDGSGFGEGPRGVEAVTAHYTQLFEEHRNVCEFDIDRIVVDENVIVTEGWFDQVFPGAILRKRGADIDDPEAIYAHRMRIVLIWPYDDAGKLLGEDSYANGTMYAKENIRKLSRAEIPNAFYEVPRRGQRSAGSSAAAR